MLTIKETQLGRSYEVTKDSDPDKKVVLDFINASTPGILTNEALLFVLIMRLRSLDQELPCDENKQAIELLVQTTEVLVAREKRMNMPATQAIGIAEVSSTTREQELMQQLFGLEARAASAAGIKTYFPQNTQQPALENGLVAQLGRARALLTEVHALGSDEVKQLIEKRTGPWMVWGVNQQEPVR
jgi:hypothetical protein